MLKHLLKCERGNFAMMGVIAAPLLVAAAGLAVDYTNLSRAHAEVQNAVDAGIIAASRKIKMTEDRDTVFRDSVKSQLLKDPGMTILASNIELTQGINYIGSDAYATVSIPLVFMGRFMPNKVTARASTYFSTRDVEIAIALDNTGSMGASGISALKSASHALLDALKPIDTTEQSLKVGLIPFVTTVNVKGEGFSSNWIDMTGASLYNGWSFLTDLQRTSRTLLGNNNLDFSASTFPHHANLFSWSKTTWKGCVEARPAPFNTSMTPPDPTKPNTLFVPYFAPDEPGNRMTVGGNSGTAFNNSWLIDGVSGDNATVQRSVVKYKTQSAITADFKDNVGPLTLGPNRACPTPIVPLTEDLQKVRDGVNAMQFWNGSGTNIAEGLAWGWRVLSPEEPYAQAAEFDAEAVSKILVIMTDGTNVSFGNSSTINKSDYGSYGFLADKRINGATTQSTAEAYLNTSTANMCSDIKKLNVEVFTVIYKTTAKSVVDLFKACASRPGNFFMAADVASLKKSFSAIGEAVSSVRLTQ